MKKFESYLVFLFIGLFNCYAQNSGDALSTIDSLKRKITTPTDRDGVALLNQVSINYRNINGDSALLYGRNALNAARDLNFRKGIYNSYYTIAASYNTLAKYDSAILWSDKVLDEADSLVFYDEYLGALIYKSHAYYFTGRYQEALALAIKRMQMSSPEDFSQYADGLLNLGLIYWKLNKSNKAKQAFEEALSLYSAINNKYTDSKKSDIFGHLASIHVSEGDYESALKFDLKSLRGKLRSGDKRGISVAYNNIGTDYLDTGRPDSAIYFFHKALQIRKLLDDRHGITTTLLNLSRVYGKLNSDSSVFYLNEAIEAAKSINSLEHLSYAHRLLYSIEEGLSNYENALKAYKTYILYRDSIFSNSNSEKVSELELKYETEKKDNEIYIQNAKLSQQTTQRNALLLGIVLLVIISLLIYRSQRIKSRVNDQLKETEALKNRWLANVSHELKTPLTLVQAPLTKVLDSAKLNEIDRSDLKVANRSVKQLKRLVSEILDLSKLDKGHLELHPATIDFADLVRVTSYAFESLAISRGTQLRVEAETSCWMHVDEHQMRKTIENLLTNALKFTKEDDTITVGLKVENEAVQLTVKDTGMGIGIEDLPHIFDRFYQAQDPAKSRIGGTGIGLSLTKEIIEMHEGAITVVSKEGQETTFTISLPTSLLREAPEEEVPSQEDDEEIPSAPDSQYQEIITELPRLLLVEDNDDMRNFLINDLKTSYTITKALDGKDALQKLRGTTYDVIISDIMMPRMDGLSLIQEVKKNPDWKKIPLIVLTALDGEEDRLEVLRTGVDDYITKPFNSEELKVRLQNLINNSKSRSDAEDIDEEDSLLASIEKDIKIHLADPEYTVKAMAENAAMSERSLRRYVKKVTGLSPIGLITELKLQKAMQLLEKRSFRSLKEVCLEIGFDRTGRFSTTFEKRFGKRPADYL